MKSSQVGLLSLVIATTMASASASASVGPCFVAGECVDSLHVGSSVVANKEECLDLCSSDDNCGWFTYYPKSKYCELLANCTTLDVELCRECLSGESNCETSDPTCWAQGECTGEVLQVQETVSSRTECLRACKQTDGCNWFTYFPSSFVCVLLSDCDLLEDGCDGGCFSGESGCEEEYPPESHWHMIIGGKSASAYINSVELYNWQTGEQCFLSSLPAAFGQHSGAFFEGVPVVCGGLISGAITDCYHYEASTNKWLKVGSLPMATYNGESVVVEGQGWLIYGGNSRGIALRQPKLGEPWMDGPRYIDGASDTGLCIVKQNENVTVLLGGNRGANRIMTYDWSKATYALHEPQLLRGRVSSACALIKGVDGFPRVAILGGTSKGMEFWNPLDDSVEMVTEELPQEEGATMGLIYTQIIPIKEGSEFMLYGGYKGSHHKGIWNYKVAENLWTRVGSTLVARGEHVVLPVTGITCSANSVNKN